MAEIIQLGESQHSLLRNHDTAKFAPTVDFRECVMQGLYPGRKFVRINGLNPDIDAGAKEDVWSAGGIFQFLPSPDFIDLVSDSTDDTVGGIGAQQVLVNGLDELGIETSEILSLDGVTPVQTIRPYVHVQRVRTILNGTNLFNVGTISITGASSTLLVGQIRIGTNTTTNGCVMVPTNQAYYTNGLFFALSKQTNTTGLITIYAKPNDEAWSLSTTFGLNSNGAPVQYQVIGPGVFTPRTQVRIEAEVSGNAVQVTSFMEFLSVEILFTRFDGTRRAGHGWKGEDEFVGDG